MNEAPMYSRGIKWWIITLCFFMSFFVAIILIQAITGEPDHRDINDRQQHIEDQLAFISCLLLVEADETSPERVAICSSEPSE